jgi:hypothetical protein
VCYSFAVNTVFQAIFTTFLVAPGYGKRITSFEELVNSDLIYGRDISLENALKHFKIYDHRLLKLARFECPNHVICLHRLFTKGDITTLSLKIDAEYVYSYKVSGHSRNIKLCTVNDNILVLETVLCLTKGHPLLDRFNTVIRRSMETGLVEKYWSELNFNLQLQSLNKSKDTECELCSNMYFVFSLSHLRAAFLVLGFGYALSVIVFIFELFCKLNSKKSCNCNLLRRTVG